MSIWDDYKGSILNPINLFAREDPSKEANKYLSQIPAVGRQSYNPFIQGGQEAGGILKNEYQKQLNPTAFIDEIMKHYQTSQGAQYLQDKLGRGIGATAAAGGIAGTPEHQQEYGELANNMQQYLMNALGVHGAGITGEENFYNKGYDASKELADLLGGTLSSQGTLGYMGAQQKNTDRNALLNALVKALSQGSGAASG